AQRVLHCPVDREDGEGRRPEDSLIEQRVLVEPDAAVAGVELRLRLEEDDDLSFASVGREPVPGLRIEVGRLLGDDLVQLLGDLAVRPRKTLDRFQAGLGLPRAFRGALGRAALLAQLRRALFHRVTFGGAERSLVVTHCASPCVSSWMRSMFPAGSRTAASRMPSSAWMRNCTISAPAAA